MPIFLQEKSILAIKTHNFLKFLQFFFKKGIEKVENWCYNRRRDEDNN